MSNEWALVIFTVLAQASVGSFIVLTLLKQVIAKSSGTEKSEAMVLKPFTASFSLVVLAMLASLFHLESPLRAPFSIFNVGSSWLSREILFICLFALAWLLYVLLSRKKAGSDNLRRGMLWLGVAAGLLNVFSMCKIYMLETQPAWNTVMTPVIFFGSVFAIGGILAAVIFFSYNQSDAASVLRLGTVISAIGAIVALIGVVGRYLILSGSDIAAAAASAGLIKSNYFGMFTVGVIALVLGLGAMVLVYRKIKQHDFSLKHANFALAAIVLGVVLDRLIFYSAHIRIGF